MSDLLTELCDQFEAASAGLAGVARQRMFGCDAFFRDGGIFGLIWKEGRLGVRLPEAASFAALAAEPGTAPWQAGARVMSHWLLVPEAWHDDPEPLAAWIRTAHAQAQPKAAGTKKKAAKARAPAPTPRGPSGAAATKQAKRQPAPGRPSGAKAPSKAKGPAKAKAPVKAKAKAPVKAKAKAPVKAKAKAPVKAKAKAQAKTLVKAKGQPKSKAKAPSPALKAKGKRSGGR